MPAESTLLHRFTRSLLVVAPTGQSLARAAVLLADHLAVRGDVAAPSGSPAEDAAAAALAAARYDSDDVHWTSLVHPGAAVWATALAFTAALELSGPAALRAANAGYEAAVRLGMALEAVGGDTGNFHRTALVAPTAVAVTLSTLRGELDPSAIGHALSLAGGSAGAIRELSGTRAVHRGAAVLIGVMASDAARCGISSTEEDFEFGGGAIPAMSAGSSQLVTSADAIATTSVRVLPTSGWNQAAYEAARGAATAAGGGEVTAIRAVVSPMVIARSVTHDVWHSLPHALAHGAGAPDSLLPDIEIAPGRGAVARVTVYTTAGRATVSVAKPLDDPSRPAGPAELGGKWGLSADETTVWLAALRDWLDGTTPTPIPPPHRPSTRSAQ